MAKQIIEVSDLSKLYHLGVIGATTFRESIERWWCRRFGKGELCRKIGTKNLMIEANDPQAGPQPNTLWALKNASFSVDKGEIVGIVGKNGAGKSTLLKILSRITEPTKGHAIIRGRTASLLEVGTGFHPELTGRENTYLNGAILGMRKKEIDRKFDEIVAFAELERFIDTPVKRYSSGMYVRLAFAVAAHLEPEILLVDEVLAVGDIEFRKKCLGKMNDVAKGGRTVLFVSHNMIAVQRLCPRTIFLDKGKIVADGESGAVVAQYVEACAKGKISEGERVWKDIDKAPGDEHVRLEAIRLKNKKEQIINAFKLDEPFSIEIEYKVLKAFKGGRLAARIYTSEGVPVFTSGDCDRKDTCWGTREPGRYIAHCQIPAHFLNRGSYTITLLGDIPNKKQLFQENYVLNFNVVETAGAGGIYSAGRQGLVRPILDWATKKQTK